MSAHSEESNRKIRADWSELPALYASGVPLADLMQRYGCSRNTIHRQLGRMGVKPRRSSRRNPG
jgi:uncharacterized protein YjcR